MRQDFLEYLARQRRRNPQTAGFGLDALEDLALPLGIPDDLGSALFLGDDLTDRGNAFCHQFDDAFVDGVEGFTQFQQFRRCLGVHQASKVA